MDAMKKKTNVHLWPYMSVVIVNDVSDAHPVIEGVIMSEVDTSY